MSKITLDQIKEEQQKLAALISAFESQNGSRIVLPATEVKLNAGERYAGIILDKNGVPDYHLILLSNETESISWITAAKFANTYGGMLPSCREQALLFANLKEEFKKCWYWSCEKHHSVSHVWAHDFDLGDQRPLHESAPCIARFIRKIWIK